MDNTFPTQNIISMCPGIGGLERGLARTSLPIRTICFVEIEAFIIANMVAQMEVGVLDPAPIWTNVKTFDGSGFRGMVHGILAGYPCQPFSHTGERKGADDERHLWPFIYEQIKVIGAEFVFFENVGGHLSMGYEEVRRNLSDIGYRVEEGIFTAEEVGAPHRRERLFILGVMENASILRWGREITGYNKEGSKSKNKIKGSGTAMDNSDCECQYGKACTCGRRITEFATSNNHVANSDNNAGNISKSAERGGNIEINRIGTVMADTYGRRDEIRSNEPSEQQFIENTSSDGRVEIMDNTFNERLQGYAGDDSRAGRWAQQERSVTEASLFPAGQGNYQHEWEEPRTIESSLEYTINGYNFTEDLHRAIGNSVVEQTAELAFITLLEKHLDYL